MRHILTFALCLLTLLFSSCSSVEKNDKDKALTEKENELLKKENDLLKKEQELNNKSKSTQSTATTSKETANSNNWKTFNHKYGFTIQLPNYFSIGSLTASGLQYYTTDIDQNIMVAVESSGDGSQTGLIKDYQMRLNSEEGIKYKVLRDNWFVVSGENSEGVYYYKGIIKGGQSYFLMISYPSVHKDLMDNILPKISKSFM